DAEVARAHWRAVERAGVRAAPLHLLGHTLGADPAGGAVTRGCTDRTRGDARTRTRPVAEGRGGPVRPRGARAGTAALAPTAVHPNALFGRDPGGAWACAGLRAERTRSCTNRRGTFRPPRPRTLRHPARRPGRSTTVPVVRPTTWSSRQTSRPPGNGSR